LIFAWALQQCSATALPVITNDEVLYHQCQIKVTATSVQNINTHPLHNLQTKLSMLIKYEENTKKQKNAYILVREDAESAEETEYDISLCLDNTGDVSCMRDDGRALVDERLSDTADKSDLNDRLSGLVIQTHPSTFSGMFTDKQHTIGIGIGIVGFNVPLDAALKSLTKILSFFFYHCVLTSNAFCLWFTLNSEQLTGFNSTLGMIGVGLSGT